MAGEVIEAFLWKCDSVFGEYNYTKNRGACVHGVIWLIVCMIGQINLNECGQIIRSYIYLPLLFNSKCRRGHSPVQMTHQEIRCTEAIYPGQIYGIL